MNKQSEKGGNWQSSSALALVATVVLASAGVGCGDDATEDEGGSPAASAQRMGWIDIAEVQSSGVYVNMAEATFWRQPLDGAPVCGQTVETFAGGECTITRTVAPSCAPGCSSAERCVWNADCSAGECVAADSNRAPLRAGTVSITGGSGQPAVTGNGNLDGSYTFQLQSSDWWSDGDALTVSAAGDTFPAFSLTATAPPAPNVLTDTSAWTPDTFTSGNDVPVEWTAGEGSYYVVVALLTDVPMICVTADDGRFDIPADGIAALGTAPESWAVSVDYSIERLLNEGADGQVMVTIGTSGAAALISNE